MLIHALHSADNATCTKECIEWMFFFFSSLGFCWHDAVVCVPQ